MLSRWHRANTGNLGRTPVLSCQDPNPVHHASWLIGDDAHVHVDKYDTLENREASCCASENGTATIAPSSSSTISSSCQPRMSPQRRLALPGMIDEAEELHEQASQTWVSISSQNQEVLRNLKSNNSSCWQAVVPNSLSQSTNCPPCCCAACPSKSSTFITFDASECEPDTSDEITRASSRSACSELSFATNFSDSRTGSLSLCTARAQSASQSNLEDVRDADRAASLTPGSLEDELISYRQDSRPSNRDQKQLPHHTAMMNSPDTNSGCCTPKQTRTSAAERPSCKKAAAETDVSNCVGQAHMRKSYVQNVTHKQRLSLRQLFFMHTGNTRTLLSKVQGLWQPIAGSVCGNPDTQSEILITGKCLARADGLVQPLILKRDCIKYRKWTFTVDQDDLLCFTDDEGPKTYYKRAFLSLPEQTSQLQGEWCPAGIDNCNTSHLTIVGSCWRLTGSGENGQTCGFLHSDTEQQATLLRGFKVSVAQQGTLSLALFNGHCLRFIRHMQATSMIFSKAVGCTPQFVGHNRSATHFI